MVGLFVVVPFMQETLVPWLVESPLGSLPGIKPGPSFQGGGLSILTAGIVLAFMVLPYITAVSRDVLRMVPSVTKEAGYGMGSTTWEVMHKISLPYANSGIVGVSVERAPSGPTTRTVAPVPMMRSTPNGTTRRVRSGTS